ncbi:MAG: chromosome segregation protein SMC, partial [Candidatus Omnitrophica bacterium]|nr:chromosome segregation protein SMC [Candidatus Omnitrophota bacterium]
MLLKSLEIYGFKSFAEKTSLEFETGVTAIVGPNGCGKSNIVDAMKWVLGEQSAKELRGGSMEDVIFNGTELAEKVNFAEVSLRISNEDGKLPIDFNEVIISRRLFRTGESEYLINSVSVRLKDVQDLIAGTGIGTKAYSLMEQGKMDLIVSSKPDERRYVFEEASGITRFKNKKKEALRKLENTENNLLRVSDIVAEVRRQISSLERQARKAEKYKIIYEQVKDKELFSASAKIFEYQNIISSFSSKKVNFKDDFDKMQKLLESKETLAKHLRESIAEISEGMAAQENVLREYQAKQQRNSERINWNKQTIVESEEKTELLIAELEEILKRAELARQRQSSLDDENRNFGLEEKRLTDIISERKQALQHIGSDGERLKIEIDQIKSKILESSYELTQKKNLLLELDSEIKSLRARSVRLRENLRDILSRIEEQDLKLSRLSGELKDSESVFNSVKTKLETLLINRKNILEEKNILVASKTEIDRKISSNEVRLNSWSEIFSQGLGYSEDAKRLKDMYGDKILGSLSDIIKAPDENIERVELAFSGNLRSIVVRTREDALQLIKTSKTERFSDLNIIILDDLVPKKTESIEGAVAMANFVRLDSGYIKLLVLIEDAFYVEDFQRAQDLSLKYPAYRFLTQNNMLFQGAVLSIGFDSSKDLGFLDREGKIERLKSALESLREESKIKSAEIINLERGISKLDSEISEHENRKSECNYQIIGLNKSLDSERSNRDRLLQEKEIMDLDIEDIDSQVSGDSERRERLQLEIEQAESGLKSDEQNLLNCQQNYSSAVDKKHELSIQLAQLEARELSLNENRKKHSDIIKSVELELANLERDKQKREKEREEIILKISQLKDEIAALSSENNNLFQNISTGSSDLESKRQEYEKARLDFEKEEDELMKLRNEYSSRKDEVHDLDLNMNEEEYKIKSIKDRLNQIYNITEIPEYKGEEIDRDLLEQEIVQLKEKLQNMGEVNLIAIEEHKNLQERLLFLENQEKDLLEAKESLQAAIRKINKTTRDMFLDTFQSVRKSFKEIFPRLFGGGDADLVLDEGVDCLEAGIDILARPPGKKLQSVSLLSGGEKALTALSLLFSIFQVKPSPFCILDEVDAPLDESNIDRFRRLLEEFSRLSQFLVITHNKRTIST